MAMAMATSGLAAGETGDTRVLKWKDGKKAAFLNAVIAASGVPAQVHHLPALVGECLAQGIERALRIEHQCAARGLRAGGIAGVLRRWPRDWPMRREPC